MSGRRWDIERALVASNELPVVRHLILTLLIRVDGETGVIPEQFTPSLTDLENETGLSRSTVAKHLNGAESRGWLVRQRVAGRPTTYALHVPSSPSHGLEGSPCDGLVGVETEPTSAPGGPVLVRETDGSEPASFSSFTHINHPPPTEGGAAPTRKKPGRKPKNPTLLPERWWPDADLVAWVKTNCTRLDEEAMKTHTLRFRTWFHGKGRKQKNWPATYKNWMLGEQARLAERANETAARDSKSTPYRNKPNSEAHRGWKNRQREQAVG